MADITGKQLGTWKGVVFDSKITAGAEVGKGFRTREEALKAARDNSGAEALVQGDDGQIHVYQVDDGSSYDFTRDSIAQVKGYSVSNVSAEGSRVPGMISFVTEDDYEAVSPAVHQNPLSGQKYVFQSQNKVSAFLGRTEAEYHQALTTNTTASLSKASPPAGIKAALEPTLKILEQHDSRAADWLRQLDEGDYDLAGDGLKSTLGGTTEIYAAWTAVVRDGASLHVNQMVLGDLFWQMSDVDKASALYHEYVHAVDDPVARTFNKAAGAIGNKAEDKAYIAQWQFLKRFNITSGEMYGTVKSYLDDRKIDVNTIP